MSLRIIILIIKIFHQLIQTHENIHIAHNVFECLAADVISDILHVSVEEKCLTLQKVNIRISPF